MQMLQAREVGNRAWETLLMREADGTPAPIDERIRRGMQGRCDRTALTCVLLARMQRMRTRLESRIGALRNEDRTAARLAGLDERTLKVLVETGAWFTTEVAGPEVDVSALLPLPPRTAAHAVAGNLIERRREVALAAA
jgi:hypothetical protein